MRYLILADIHGNLPALQSVLQTPEAASCQQIISLGDQVNFGPQPREVLQLLKEHNALMLLGNHEERLLRPDSPDLQGYNWTLLHWTKQQLNGMALDFPIDLRIGPALFTHGMPGDPYLLIKHDHELIPHLDALPDGVQFLFSGHAHRLWHFTHHGRTAINPGSVGVGESNIGAQATFAIYDSDSGEISRHAAFYDADRVARAFLHSGAIHAAPMMCRIVLQTIYTGCETSVPGLMRHIIAVAAPLGLTLGDEAAWHAADASFAWTEPLSTPDYWNMMEDKLL